MKWLIKTFGTIVLVVILCFMGLSYSPPVYSSINLTLIGGYTPPAYDNINLVLSYEPVLPDTNFTIWSGSAWVQYPDDSEYLTFRCEPTQIDCEPDNQNVGSSQSIFQVCNNGTAAGTNVYFNINQTLANIALECDDDYTVADAITLTTSNQSIHGELAVDACIYVSCWADYTSPAAGGFLDVNAYVS